MEKLEKALETLNVKIKRYATLDNTGLYDITVVGGIERIHTYSIKDMVKESNEVINIEPSVGDRTLMPYRHIDVKFDVKHIEELRKFRDMKTLSKEESLNHEVIKKEDLANKIVYIHESNPSTNSLALAKQFQIRHDHVISQIFKITETNPSVLMGIKYGVYELVNNGQSPENQSPESSVDSNLGISTFRTFLHISEDVYYKFILNMGTPKSNEMKAYRAYKIEEYFKAFQTMRERLYQQGYKEDEILTLIKKRTIVTKELIDTMRDYAIFRNDLSGIERKVSIVSLARLLFNIINKIAKIDAKHYKHKSKDRSGKDIETQMLLTSTETRVIEAMNNSKHHSCSLVDELCRMLKITIDDITKMLQDNKVEILIPTLEKL